MQSFYINSTREKPYERRVLHKQQKFLMEFIIFKQVFFIEFFKELFKSFVDQGDVPNESCLGIKFLVNWGYVPKEEEL